jgi:cupin superfamily acireductone dioxygenase involved in methionine salvage
MNPIFEKTNLQEDQSFFIEEIKKPFFSGKLHFHPEIEIIYVREGSGIKYIGDSITPFYPGDLVIIGSNIPHLWSSDPDHLNSAANQMINVVSIKFTELLKCIR